MNFQQNNLVEESSPYLLQHQTNPIWWQSWNQEALDYAKENNKPILVSIGYSACHWCHVMEKECFEDEEVAEYMNAHFVSIKVDREERPDIDAIYMNAVQATNGQGGWPLNCFTLSNQKPIFGGTYFPKEKWMQLLKSIVELVDKDPQKAVAFAQNLFSKLESNSIFASTQNLLSKEEIAKSVSVWSANFDTNWGGFIRSPKFMLPVCWDFLLAYACLEKNQELLSQVKLTLDRMSWGGLYDQLRGGFSRYSVDDYWKVPHFEKMLYDNAQLIGLYANAYKQWGDVAYKTVVEETIAWLDAEMLSDNGGYYAALDADSDGEEGKFYIWEIDELKAILKDEYDVFALYYSVEGFGHWEESKQVLMRLQSDRDFCLKNNLKPENLDISKAKCKEILLKERNKRIKPGLDNKIITSWNGILVSAFCDAYKALGHEEYKKKAKKTLDFILNKHIRQKNDLYRVYNEDKNKIKGFLDDYAYTIKACIEYYQISFEENYLIKAKELLDFVLIKFKGEKEPFLNFSSNSNLFIQNQEVIDSVIPSSNALMAENLLKIYQFFGENSYKLLAEKMIGSLQNSLITYPQGHALWMKYSYALSFGLSEFVVNNPQDNLDINKTICKKYMPFTVLAKTNSETRIPLLKGKYNADKDLYYLCENQACKTPTSHIEDALKL